MNTLAQKLQMGQEVHAMFSAVASGRTREIQSDKAPTSQKGLFVAMIRSWMPSLAKGLGIDKGSNPEVPIESAKIQRRMKQVEGTQKDPER